MYVALPQDQRQEPISGAVGAADALGAELPDEIANMVTIESVAIINSFFMEYLRRRE